MDHWFPSCCCKAVEALPSYHQPSPVECSIHELSCLLLSRMRVKILIRFCLISSLQSAFVLTLHRGMGSVHGDLLYLDVFYSFSGSYTSNIEWFSDLPTIHIPIKRFFQYSETIDYQATNIFASNKYHLGREGKNAEDYFHLLRDHYCALEEDETFEKKRA